ncbi:hypothetical protein P170DRAFT_435237 [Aspergillus steynii IBT 23096]|uniref:Tat pathway signal sequence n=1 Tax=Aspergillus steynii IBT 23096 TaxID=1392250 RepID=A0A2I2GAQ0_9EURO|nr:uncharacterized protein P170DRAFT_435237 [Aspergillus steynii IBT 23096]PLB49953.1 hypothetical protein P170DRAFT_435237 [Aspergillus steynii IBT 23096]
MLAQIPDESKGYHHLRSSDDSEAQPDDSSSQALLFDGNRESRKRTKICPWPSRNVLKSTAFFLVTLGNAAMFFSSLLIFSKSDYLCMQRNAIWSPVWEDVSTAYTHTRFNGTLDAPSQYRGPPSSAVDEAWSELDNVGSVALDEETFLRAGGTKENARMPDDLGGGYMADIEVLHQMHCLNFVRMAVYAEHYRDIAPEWRDSNRTFNIHLDHCIEMIRINLLCQADGGVIPFRWVENYRRPLPDFSTKHKCRDWQAVLQWAKDRQVTVPSHYPWKPQSWEKVFPKPTWMVDGKANEHEHGHRTEGM